MKILDLVRTLERYVAKNGTLVVGVCGHAGAGKSTLCKDFIEHATIPTIRLNCDLFSTHGSRDRLELIAAARATCDQDKIDAVENPLDWYAYDAIAAAISDLRLTGLHSYKSAWNSETGELDGSYDVSLPDQRPAIILCDGIYLLHPPIRQALDITVRVDATTDVLDQRGLARSKGDIERAQQHRAMRERFAVPYFDLYGWLADIVIDGKAETSDL